MSRDQKPGRVSIVTSGAGAGGSAKAAEDGENSEIVAAEIAALAENTSGGSMPSMGGIAVFLVGTILGSAGFVYLAHNLG